MKKHIIAFTIAVVIAVAVSVVGEWINLNIQIIAGWWAALAYKDLSK